MTSTAPSKMRCRDLSTGQLLDRLEWAYGETGGFEPEVVWELARRVPREP